ncbi:hypothetical protein [Streptomyces xiaopingdaonensis]|uniref:hypothetical protein n=1 Tax=Streptomyces xiaopingdaonensis TaxID=1565415 RepID=UPI0002DB85C8|nr:hypothetical protein [Streptomyces xiaopingdaonensis]
MDTAYPHPAPPLTLDRRDGPYGEVVLRRRGEVHEIIANGCFLMDSSDGRSERLLVRAALAELGERPDPTLLLGGLGVGFSLAEAAAEPRWARVTTVEREPAIVEWHTAGGRPLAPVTAQALADPRTELVVGDLVEYLRGDHLAASGSWGETAGGGAASSVFDVMALDIDNGPDWTVTEGNADLYTPEGLALCRERLAPGGVLAVWSARPSAAFETAMRNAGFDRVRTDEVQVARGVPDAVHFGRRA